MLAQHVGHELDPRPTAAPVGPQGLGRRIYLEAVRNPKMRRTEAEALDAFEQFAVVALKALGARDPDGAAPAFVALVDGFALHRLARPRPRADEVAGLRRGLRALFLAEIVDPGELAPWTDRLHRPIDPPPSG